MTKKESAVRQPPDADQVVRVKRRRRKKNRGWFRKGPDPRRHQLTSEERARGGETFFLAYSLINPADPRFPLLGKGACRKFLEGLKDGETA